MSDAPPNDRIHFGTLTYLLLENFKAFGRMQRIPIRPITLIYGKNNSGKSSIIQALLYAEHVRRTHDFDPQVVTKDNHRVLEGGLSRLIHGHGRKHSRFGWEWANPKSRTGIEAGRFIQNLDDSDVILEATLNGERFLKFTDQAEMWLWPAPERKHPLFLKALANVQRWLAAEFRLFISNNEGSAELRQLLTSVCEDLETGGFGGVIEDELFDHPHGFRVAQHSLPPIFHLVPQVDEDWDAFQLARVGSRATALLAREVETVDRFLRHQAGATDPKLSWGLKKSLYEHVEQFVTERGAYILHRWLQDAWAHVAGPLDRLVGTVHYLGAVRSRPGRIILREPVDRSKLDRFRRQSQFPEHRDWIFQVAALEQANRWLRKHRKLTGNIEMCHEEEPLAAKLSIHDRDRRLKLSFTEVGYGVSQFLPVLLASFAQQDSFVDGPSGTLLVEEPEAHVHPALQSEIGDLFIDAVTRRERPLAYVICETHSEHLLLRMMRRIREGKLSPAKVAVLYVENLGKESIVREMPLNEKGELIRDWPGGFFEEGLRDILL